MSEVKTITVNRSAYADNDEEADILRAYLKSHGTFLVNLMSSPGAGKTTTLTALINELKKDLHIGVMEAVNGDCFHFTHRHINIFILNYVLK